MAMNSIRLLAKSGFASIRLGEVPSSEIGTKSLIGSYATVLYKSGLVTRELEQSSSV